MNYGPVFITNFPVFSEFFRRKDQATLAKGLDAEKHSLQGI